MPQPVLVGGRELQRGGPNPSGIATPATTVAAPPIPRPVWAVSSLVGGFMVLGEFSAGFCCVACFFFLLKFFAGFRGVACFVAGGFEALPAMEDDGREWAHAGCGTVLTVVHS